MSGQPGEDKLPHPRISEHVSSGKHHAREMDKHDHPAGTNTTHMLITVRARTSAFVPPIRFATLSVE